MQVYRCRDERRRSRLWLMLPLAGCIAFLLGATSTTVVHGIQRQKEDAPAARDALSGSDLPEKDQIDAAVVLMWESLANVKSLAEHANRDDAVGERMRIILAKIHAASAPR